MPSVAQLDELDPTISDMPSPHFLTPQPGVVFDFGRVLESVGVFHYILYLAIGQVLIVMLGGRTLDSVVDTMAWAVNAKST